MYEEKLTQEQQILKLLEQGEKITQIDLIGYFEMKNGNFDYVSPYIDALELGIANLPARIWGLKKKGYDIKTIDVKTKNSHYAVYAM